MDLGDDALGAMVEWQVASLEPSAGKEHVRDVVRRLCDDAVACYEGVKWPMRRAR